MKLLSALTILVLMATGASAAIVDGTITPGSWQVDGSPVITVTTLPGPWVASDWVSISSNASGGALASFLYTTTIDTTGLMGVSFTLTILQDDTLAAMSLSGGGVQFTGTALPVAYNASGVPPAGVFNFTPNDNSIQTLSLTIDNTIDPYTGLSVKVSNLNSGSPFNPIPEPATYALVGLGLAGLALIRRRKA